MDIEIKIILTMIAFILLVIVYLFGLERIFPRNNIFWFGGKDSTLYGWVFSSNAVIRNRLKYTLLVFNILCIVLLWLVF